MNAKLPDAAAQSIDKDRLEAFCIMEARLQDESRYDDWEALWTTDGVYWVPCNGDDGDPEQVVSIIYDNRVRIASRIRQLNSGRRHAQIPASRMRRVMGNFEFSAQGSEFEVACNFILTEGRRGSQRIWSGRTVYRLRDTDAGLRMARKAVYLVGNDEPIDTLAFLI